MARGTRRPTGARRIGLPAAATAALIAFAGMGNVTGASGVADPGTSGSFSVEPGLGEEWTVPDGVNVVDFTLTGGRGADKGVVNGGAAATVTGSLNVGSLAALFVRTGENGSGTNGGFNGGGDAQTSAGGAAVGGGGGGASDIRTIGWNEAGSLESRLAVAGGGGGAGSRGNGSSGQGGGNGGNSGASANGSSGSNGSTASLATAAGGGGGGTTTAGGAAGAAGQDLANNEDGTPGTVGQLGQGGTGGRGPNNSPAGWGGGGGGGLYGGGGGGGGAVNSGAGSPVALGGAGGGGGSSLVPAGGTLTSAAAGSGPAAQISWSTPGTEITAGPPVTTNEIPISFEFDSSSASEVEFTCQLDAVVIEDCVSPFEAGSISDGLHHFSVFATDALGNFDPTPAEWSFTLDRAAPVTVIESGPAGKTTEKRPEFKFGSTETGVTFECRFDQEPFGACSGAGSDRPAADLPAGKHRFEVRATDGAGNVGEVASRDFEVEGVVPPPPPPPPDPPKVVEPRISLGKPKLNRKRGIATLKATVNQAGTVRLVGSKTVKAAVKQATVTSTVTLKVRAKGKALKKLKRRGFVKLRATAELTTTDGRSAGAGRTVTLKLKKKRR